MNVFPANKVNSIRNMEQVSAAIYGVGAMCIAECQMVEIDLRKWLGLDVDRLEGFCLPLTCYSHRSRLVGKAS